MRFRGGESELQVDWPEEMQERVAADQPSPRTSRYYQRNTEVRPRETPRGRNEVTPTDCLSVTGLALRRFRLP